LAIFLAIHWQEVTSPTYNLDDWALISSRIPQASQSRPGWDLIYHYLFQHSYLPFAGWLIAAASLFAVAAVPRVFFAWITPPWICLLALLIAAHAYLLDLFAFSFAIGLYLLPAPLSLWGGVLMAVGRGRRQQGLDWCAGVLLFVLAMSIYQPTGYLAVAVLGFLALAASLGTSRFPRTAVLRLLAGVLCGGLLYYLWTRISMAGVEENSRTGFADLPRLLEKLGDLSVARGMYATSLPLQPRAPQLLFSLTFLLLALIASLLLARRSASTPERLRRLGLLWLAAGLFTLLPFLLFLVLRAPFPPRAFCLANFGIAAFSVIVLAWMQTETMPTRRLSRWLVGGLIAAYLIPQAAFAARVWDLTQLVERRDMAMATMIVTDVRREARERGLPAEPFWVFGTSERTQLFPSWQHVAGWVVGESAFHQQWGIEGLFWNLLGARSRHLEKLPAERVPQVRKRFPLPPCRAYPEPGSIVPYRGGLMVCLEPTDTPPAVR
jgi:hypothetical protein